ncbi:MAG: MucB/RseB C-terminal domain-containing protein [Gammaproteobacteria bacterium]|nr:MucB/RseB C-terminal domain-containing protein [Gammaproteobacteria bacterium]
MSGVLLLSALAAAAQDNSAPAEWLRGMSRVVSNMDYEGTVIRRQNGKTEALKLVHKIIDGVVHERLVTQEGNGLEIIRVGNEVHCILPDRKSVLIEQWNNQSTLFSTLPGGDISFGAYYDLSVVREERVAGRPAVLVAVRPHDQFRFGHRLWLDRQTAFPLRTELVDQNGVLIEEIKFADIRFGEVVASDALEPSLSLDDFTWYTEPAKAQPVPVRTDWISDDLPGGFGVVSTTSDSLSGTIAPVTHIVYSDGLAAVSVFIGKKSQDNVAERSRIGSSSSYSAVYDDYRITAVGEVPQETVKRIASSMRQTR